MFASLARHPQRSVLIVDESADSREVLRTALERRGLSIFEASCARQGLEMARRHHPSVIVLDLESEAADDETVRRQYDAQSNGDHSSLVVLGTVRLDDGALPHAKLVAKPYHYAPLVRTIEQLLEYSNATQRDERHERGTVCR